MNEQILIAGFGGQGVLSMGKMLAEAAMAEGHEVSWLPSYGPEMRGGTSNVSVNISDKPIGAPIISPGDATCVMAMNLPSLTKFESFVKPGGLLLVNSSIIDKKATRTDITVYYVKANDLANELGNPKTANMIMLGAYLEKAKVVKPETMLDQLRAVFGAKKPQLVELNENALKKGADSAK
ncbi:MAG: 2-oxoacid:acceptor oxidoreductase family protein [Deltaproteobacteria bacterium]|jgi:2-oxoglutarate ferredoxin oxidoreductase subunit gamma|nr:2-oxoacid:acceptor oxidoreductase family protein [Deltaproteobacteria bacterium]